MKNLLTVFAITTLITASASAELLTTKPGEKNYDKTNVNIAESATAQLGNETAALQYNSSGIRNKFAVIPVYVAELFLSDKSQFKNSEEVTVALDSLDNVPVVAIQLNFVRGVGIPDIKAAFEDSLKANKNTIKDHPIDIKSANIVEFLKNVSAGGDAEKGKALTVITLKQKDGNDSVYYEGTNGQPTKVTGPRGFAKQILSIWLGKTTDNGLESFKHQLITGSN
jgi:hypothetical protein